MSHTAEDAKIALDIVENSPSVALRVKDFAGSCTTLFVTDNISKFGYRKQDLLAGKINWRQIVHPDDVEELCRKVAAYAADGVDKYTCFYRMQTPSGNSVWVADSTTVTRDENGKALYMDCVISDHTQIKENQERIEDSLKQQRVLNDILQALHTSQMDKAFQIILDSSGKYLDISRVLLFEDSPNHAECRVVYEWVNKGIAPLMDGDSFILNYQRDMPEIESELQMSGMKIINYGEIPQGCQREFQVQGVNSSAIYAVFAGDVRYGFICFDECVKQRVWKSNTIAFLKNVSKLVSNALMRKRDEESIHYMAYNDQLTGLTNRYRFDMFLAQSIVEARKSGRDGYVLFIDMDDFKVINEGYGHDYGDALLVAVANYLHQQFSARSQVFRFGGDEFTLLIGYKQADAVFHMIDELLERGRQPWKVLNREFYCTFSVGVVRFPDGDLTVTDVIKNADIAMYQAKNQGKNSYVLYNSQRPYDDPAQRVEIEHRMRSAIENGFEGFCVHYQPIMDTKGGIKGAEALVRWKDGNKLMPPGDFIPLAEYLRLIIPLGEFVMREAAKECRRINEVLPDFYMSINVSIRQFQQQGFVRRVEEVMQETGVKVNNIVFEMTEGLLVQDIDHMRVLLRQLREMGIRIAMDDFGTGYSSLGNMRQLPLDVVKIDRVFICDVTRDAYSKSFVRLITDLSHSMGRDVCVEGVETLAQLEYCRGCWVDSVQGFYYHRPMAAEDLHRMLGDFLTMSSVENAKH